MRRFGRAYAAALLAPFVVAGAVVAPSAATSRAAASGAVNGAAPAAASAGTAATANAADTSTDPGVVTPIPRAPLCQRPLSRLQLYRGSSNFTLPHTLTILGQTIRVDLATFSIGAQPYLDPSRMLWYRSLLWLAVAAVNAREAGYRGAAQTAADAMIRAATQWPDPGSATPDRLRLANHIGWDEGTTFRRAEALLCLSSVTGPNRVRPLLMEHARAMLDPNRYYGPPQRRVHNHGMLTNLILMDIARVLTVPTFRTQAIARLRNDYGMVFSPQGWAREGSSTYESVNIGGWREVQRDLVARGESADARLLQSILNRAADLNAHLISPSGRHILIGNSRPTDEVIAPPPRAGRPLTVVDPDGGIAAARWSWTDRRTTSWLVMNQPRVGAHGHHDNGSVVWHTERLPILVDPGQPDYDRTNVVSAWSRTAGAHNRSVPRHLRRDRKNIRSLTAARFGRSDRVTLTTTDQGSLQRREILVDDRRHTLQVDDRSRGRQVQHWHLDTRWQLRSATVDSAVFGYRGRTLTVSAPGGSLSVLRGSSVPMAGWQTTGFERQVPASEIVISGGPALQTIFREYRRRPVLPPAPSVDRASRVGDGRVQLRLLWPDAATVRHTGIEGYRVQQLVPRVGWVTTNPDTNRRSTRIRVKNLSNGVAYRFRVAALTGRAMSDFGPVSKRFRPCAVNAHTDSAARRRGSSC